ncbi:hypothetical protein Salat_2001600 [Sesamum alatum]|uniref:B box-type domain-containing protein n=1 Tax=Sesamum alatum TaxID=300844 RepID=A0AAE2CFT4_9LAMI|nr:hypothetical protein Salat_2001600 [Sesamum alatum]
MQRCELCKGKARMHCDSDQASLCWDCDARVHSANFLVARHSRNLLCHVCQSPTPWSASGPKLGPTVSVCEQCVHTRRGDESSEEEEEMGERQEVVEENQVVPWSPPPAVESCSSGEESVSGGEAAVSRKRRRIENASSNFRPDEDRGCSSYKLQTCAPPPPDAPANEAVGAKDSSLSRRKTTPLHKIQKTELGRVDSCGSGILDSLRRLHQEETDSGREMTELCMIPGPSI